MCSLCAICKWQEPASQPFNSGIPTRGSGGEWSVIAVCESDTDQAHSQPHMQARFAILQVFLSAGPEFCKLNYSKDDASDLTIYLDRNKIESHGRPAVNSFLQKLHIYKSTADVKALTSLFDKMTNVDDWYANKLRPEVIRQAKPRKVFVQANTFLDGEEIVLKEYEPSPEGMIQSFVDRDYI